jgi:hypothetical protein
MIEMPELALTHFPAQQHQDGKSNHAENAEPSLHRVGVAGPVQVNPSSDVPRKRKREDSHGHEDGEQQKSVLVKLLGPNN